MKILAIYFKTGSGINAIYERLVAQLTAKESAVVDVLCNEPTDQDEALCGVRNHFHATFSSKKMSWYRKFLRWFGTTPVSDQWSRNVAQVVSGDYDVVLACCSSTQLTPAVCGQFIAQQLGCKFGIYVVDAIPAPGGWIKRKSEFRGKLRIVRRILSKADYVAAANRNMLEYQLSVFPHKEGLQTDVLYTSSPEVWYTNPISERTLFLYTGSLYGLRNSDYLLGAFKRILAERPEAELMLVGLHHKLRHIDRILTPEEQQHIVLAPHTDNLAPLFADAKVLIDIDADRQKDPFLSSKITTYLRVNRMIVCETGEETPSRELFAGLNTVVQCNHCEESMYQGMKRALELASTEQDFSERGALINLFSATSVGEVLWSGLKRLTSTIE